MRKILFLIVVVLLVITSAHIWMTQEKTSQKKQIDSISDQETQVGRTQIGGGFTLTDQLGNVVHDTDFHGRLMLVFFGFTQCPDECPMTLEMISRGLVLLGGKADQVAPLFITVDPGHDTPQVMKNYLANFDKHFIGLTGTEDQIKEAQNAYKVYAEKKQGADKNDYTINHSSYIYLMDKEGKFLAVMPSGASEKELSHEIEHYLND